MEKVGKSMDTAHTNYEQAMNKLTSGRGELGKANEKFRELVQPSKRMSQHLQQLSQDD